MSKVRSSIIGLVWATLLCGFVSTAQAQNPTYGMNTHYLDGFLADKMATLGAGFVRIDFDWDALQPVPGSPPNFASKWADVQAAQSRGLQVFASLAYTPYWANGNQGRNCSSSDLRFPVVE
jgi:hypothetical protein